MNESLLPRRSFLATAFSVAGSVALGAPVFAQGRTTAGSEAKGEKILIAHRGASAYAPENTLEAYRLAIRQGADYVEQDLQITRDGVLVCSHDSVLERVTNVEEVFPDRFQEEVVKGKPVRKWYIHDFTLEELKRLDAGSSLAPKFKGVTIPTWQEAIDEIRGKAGLCPETKGPETYGRLGFDMEKLVAETLQKNGLDTTQGNDSTPIILQSFSKPGLLRLRDQYKLSWPLLQLNYASAKLTPTELAGMKKYAWGIGPSKRSITADLVNHAHELGLKVIPYTFQSGDAGAFKTIAAEMRQYLDDLGIDGLFTNNPDQFPRGG
jgi:glycerophosphoryl diester phosphodiesterase